MEKFKQSRLDKIKSLGKNIFKATGDVGTFLGASGTKLPAEGADLVNEFGKLLYLGHTGKDANENIVDNLSEKYINFINEQAKGQLNSPTSKKYADEFQTGADIILPSMAISKIKKVKNLSKVDGPLIEKTESIIDKAKTSFGKFLSKDRKIKKAKDDLVILKKEFKKDTKKLTIEQQNLAKEHIVNEQARITSMEKNSWADHLIKTKNKERISKNLNKIVNPEESTGIFKKIWKNKGRLVVISAIGLAAYNALSDDEKNQIEGDPIITNVPNKFGEDKGKTEKGDNDNIDTAMDEKKSGDSKQESTTPKDTKETGDSTEVVAGEMGTITGDVVPLLLINGSFGVRKPDGSFYTLISGVTNANKRHKYTMIANKPLPF